MKLNKGGKMLDYLKLASRIFIVLFLIFFVSTSYAEDNKKQLDEQNSKELLDEQNRAVHVARYLSYYIEDSNFCFGTKEECKIINEIHIKKMISVIESQGWTVNDYNISIASLKFQDGSHFIRIKLYLRSFVSEGSIYEIQWLKKKDEIKEQKKYIEVEKKIKLLGVFIRRV